MEYPKPVRTLAKGESFRGTYRILSDGQIKLGDTVIGKWEKEGRDYRATIEVVVQFNEFCGVELSTHQTTFKSYSPKALLNCVANVMCDIFTYRLYKVQQ